MKPSSCLDAKCPGGEHCNACVNRSHIAKRAYYFMRVLEDVPASIQQTAAVNAFEEFAKFAEAAQENEAWFTVEQHGHAKIKTVYSSKNIIGF